MPTTRASSPEVSEAGRPRAGRPALLVLAALSAALLAPVAAAQTQETSGAFWPAFDVHVSLPPSLSLLAYGEMKTDEEFPYRQADFGATLGWQLAPILTKHRPNADTDKEHTLVVGAGYEHLETIQSGVDKFENRILLDATPRFRPLTRLLLSDRNQFEFRWVNGDTSTRYRNRVSAEVDVDAGGVAFTPYASAEFFYDVEKGAWNEEQYAAGIQLPWRKVVMLDIYYLRQNQPSGSPPHLDVVGLTLNLYLGL